MFKKHFLVIGLVLLCFVLFPANKVEACDFVLGVTGFPGSAGTTATSTYQLTQSEYATVTGYYINYNYQYNDGYAYSIKPPLPVCYVEGNYGYTYIIGNFRTYVGDYPGWYQTWVKAPIGSVEFTNGWNWGATSYYEYHFFQPAAQNVYNFWSGDLCGTTSGGNNPANIQSWNYSDPNCFKP